MSLWPWPLTSEITAIVGHTRLGTLSEYQVHILVILYIRLFVFDLWAIGPKWLRLITWPCDLDLWPWRSWRLWLMWSSSSIRIPSLKFVGLAILKIWRTMCVSINGPSDPYLWPFDLKTGVRVASKMGKLPSKFAHAFPLVSRIIRYVRDGRTDGQTKATLIPPSLLGRLHNNNNTCVSKTQYPPHGVGKFRIWGSLRAPPQKGRKHSGHVPHKISRRSVPLSPRSVTIKRTESKLSSLLTYDGNNKSSLPISSRLRQWAVWYSGTVRTGDLWLSTVHMWARLTTTIGEKCSSDSTRRKVYDVDELRQHVLRLALGLEQSVINDAFFHNSIY